MLINVTRLPCFQTVGTAKIRRAADLGVTRLPLFMENKFCSLFVLLFQQNIIFQRILFILKRENQSWLQKYKGLVSKEL